MSTTETTGFISSRLRNAVTTDVDVESAVTRDCGRAEEARERWQNLIDYKLIDWSRDPSQLDDEGVEPPTPKTLQRAIKLAQEFRDAGDAAPDTVVPDPNGGIVFERRRDDVCEVFHVWDDASVEYRRFQGTTLVQRRSL